MATPAQQLLLPTKGAYHWHSYSAPPAPTASSPQRSCIRHIVLPKCFVSLSVVSLKMERAHSAAAAAVDSPNFIQRPAREREAALR